MAEFLLKPEPLLAETFQPYGDVIEVREGAECLSINYGHTQRFHDLASLDLLQEGGRSLVNIFRSTPLEQPIKIEVMERHPLSSQLFFPLSNRPYLVVVSDAEVVEPSSLKVFIASAIQGVNYHPGIWHHYSLALDQMSDFLVIDRGGPGKNCEEIFFNDDITIIIED